MFEKIAEWLWRQRGKSSLQQLGSRGANTELLLPIHISIPQNLHVGSQVYVGPEAYISTYAPVYIGNGSIFGPRVKIFTGNHRYENPTALPYDEVTLAKSVRIGENVWVGADVLLLPGVEVGEGAVIAAGAVVTKSVPKGAVVGGNPAKVLKYRDLDNYDRLKAEGKIYLAMKAAGELQMRVEQG
jgi:acetyltransferase-like isoleucine patch superfamily enzyme